MAWFPLGYPCEQKIVRGWQSFNFKKVRYLALVPHLHTVIFPENTGLLSFSTYTFKLYFICTKYQVISIHKCLNNKLSMKVFGWMLTEVWEAEASVMKWVLYCVEGWWFDPLLLQSACQSILDDLSNAKLVLICSSECKSQMENTQMQKRSAGLNEIYCLSFVCACINIAVSICDILMHMSTNNKGVVNKSATDYFTLRLTFA